MKCSVILVGLIAFGASVLFGGQASAQAAKDNVLDTIVVTTNPSTGIPSPGATTGPQRVGDWVRMPREFLCNHGNRILGYFAQQEGAGCRGWALRAVAAENNAQSYGARAWTTATRQDGGIVCSNGTWASHRGNIFGKEEDVLIRDGWYYMRRGRCDGTWCN